MDLHTCQVLSSTHWDSSGPAACSYLCLCSSDTSSPVPFGKTSPHLPINLDLTPLWGRRAQAQPVPPCTSPAPWRLGPRRRDSVRSSLELPPREETPAEEEASTERAGPGLQTGRFLVSPHNHLAHPGLRPAYHGPVCYLSPTVIPRLHGLKNPKCVLSHGFCELGIPRQLSAVLWLSLPRDCQQPRLGWRSHLKAPPGRPRSHAHSRGYWQNSVPPGLRDLGFLASPPGPHHRAATHGSLLPPS